MIIYVESEIPQEQQKYRGWFYVKETRTFMRWNEFIEYEDWDD